MLIGKGNLHKKFQPSLVLSHGNILSTCNYWDTCQKYKTMADKLMYIPNDDTQKYPFCRLQWLKRLDTQLNKQTNQNSLKVLKVVKTTNKKTLLWIFGDYCNKQFNVPSLPYFVYLWWLRHLPNAGHPLQWLCFSPLSRTGLPVHSFVTNARPTSHLSVSSSCF